jgi:hypothetical protein
MVKIDVSVVTPDQYDIWDSIVDTIPQGTFFHYSKWLRICAKHQNSDIKLFGLYINGDLAGGCPLYFSHLYGFIRTIKTNSMTGPYGGLIFNLPEYNQGIQYSITSIFYQQLEKAIELGNFDSVSISHSPGMNDIRYFTWNGWRSAILYTYCIDLQSYEKPEFIVNIEKKIKESHITIEESNDIDSFYELFKATWQRRGYNVPVSKSFINEIFDSFKEKNRIRMEIAVNNTGKIAAANIILLGPNRIYAWLAATDNELWKTGAHYAVYSHIIQKYQKLGYSYFDIMMANTRNLLPFAHSFNPRAMPYFITMKKGICNNLIYQFLPTKRQKYNEF